MYNIRYVILLLLITGNQSSLISMTVKEEIFDSIITSPFAGLVSGTFVGTITSFLLCRHASQYIFKSFTWCLDYYSQNSQKNDLVKPLVVFSSMATLVACQCITIRVIETTAINVNKKFFGYKPFYEHIRCNFLHSYMNQEKMLWEIYVRASNRTAQQLSTKTGVPKKNITVAEYAEKYGTGSAINGQNQNYLHLIQTHRRWFLYGGLLGMLFGAQLYYGRPNKNS